MRLSIQLHPADFPLSYTEYTNQEVTFLSRDTCYFLSEPL